MYDFLEDYEENWPGGYIPPEHKARRSLVTVKIIDDLKRRAKYTPDFHKLRLCENILVFVYDHLRVGGELNRVFEESKYLGHATTTHDHYTMRGHAFPIVLECNTKNSPIRGRIKGEVFAVPPETLLVLDKHKFNGNMHKRVLRSVFLNEQHYKSKAGNKTPSVRAWIYLGQPDVWSSEHLPIFPQFRHVKQRDKTYFEFVPEPDQFELDRVI